MTEPREGQTRPRPHIGEMSIDARLLYDHLLAGAEEPGVVVGYATLSALIGRDVQGVARGALNTARRRLMRDRNIVFGTIRSVGVKRLDDLEITGTNEAMLRHIGRTARKHILVLNGVADYEALPDEAKARLNAGRSLAGVLAAVTKPSAMRSLEGRCRMADKPLAFAQTLDAFKRG